MLPIVFRYRSRELSFQDIESIRSTITKHYSRGRSYISRILCREWNWVQPPSTGLHTGSALAPVGGDYLLFTGGVDGEEHLSLVQQYQVRYTVILEPIGNP